MENIVHTAKDSVTKKIAEQLKSNLWMVDHTAYPFI